MKTRYVPTMEICESRCCPTVSVSLQLGSILSVTGDGDANLIELTDDGTGGIGLSIDGGETMNYTRIRTIMLFLRGGNDVVDYTLTNTMLRRMSMLCGMGPGDDAAAFHFDATIASPKMAFGILGSLGNDHVTAEINDLSHADVLFGGLLGPDHDTFDVSVAGSVLEFSKFIISIDGGLGDDDLTVNALASDVDLDCLFSIELKGGWGNDELNTTYGGQVGGGFVFALDGGLGNDTIFAEAQLAPSSVGGVVGRVAGRVGDDDLALSIYADDADDATVNAVLDCGWGVDIALVIGDVTVRDIDG